MVLAFKILFSVVTCVILALYLYTHYIAKEIKDAFPPTGKFAEVEGSTLHYVEVPPRNLKAPTVVFIHGATGNLHDQMLPFGDKFGGDLRLIFVDRPGLGHSSRASDEFTNPERQAKSIADLLDQLKIDEAIIVGHSLAGPTVAAFALNYPLQTKGLVFMATVTHPWTTGVEWYYDVANTPVVGWMFANLLALPAGKFRIENGAKSVFDPAPMPKNYIRNSHLPLFLNPEIFINNAKDVARMLSHVDRLSKRYSEIAAPSFIIHGLKDDTVSPTIHSKALERDLKNSEAVFLENVGHKPEYAATNMIVEKIKQMAGVNSE